MILRNAFLLFKNTSKVPSFLSSIPNVGSALINVQYASALKYSSDSSNKISEDAELKTIMKEIRKDFGVDAKENQFSKDSDEIKVNKGIGAADEEKIDGTPPELKFEHDIIYDFDEEMLLRKEGLWEKKSRPIMERIEYHRGVEGVFDIEELVEYLREINARDIAVISLPYEEKYADQIVICCGRSEQHIEALTMKVYKMYKLKKNAKDRFPKIEGRESEWTAMDMDNIVLNVMTEEVRERIDMETLWTVGVERDKDWDNPYADLQKPPTSNQKIW